MQLRGLNFASAIFVFCLAASVSGRIAPVGQTCEHRVAVESAGAAREIQRHRDRSPPGAGTMIFAGQFAVQSWHAVHLAANPLRIPRAGRQNQEPFRILRQFAMPVFASTIPAATPATSTPPLIRNARRA